MNVKLIITAIILVLVTGIFWLVQDRGQRKAEYDQLETTLKTAATQLTKQQAARVETDRQLAESRTQQQRLQRETERLRKAIQQSADRCASTVISPDVVDGVQTYRNH
ncbi:hypothetical protein ACFVYJ_01480 [Pontibacter sp. JAM-7]|uniref:hypothetical protein n=1 Tax=Pontibacter sp. JAM-7 TaxID=3366581 RepID=UPI003AF4BB2D